MKVEAVFGWENAVWPVLVLDSAGIIRRANGAAVQLLGAQLASGTIPLAKICPADSELLQWLARRDHGEGTQLPLRLSAGGRALSFQAAVSRMTADGKDFFLAQLLGQPSEGETKILLAESGLAQKQKLECALQMARTVALDFNNALTSILGYTSLILSKLEPDSPWRGPLLGVEKSASRAAEIAHDLATFSRQEKEAKAQSSGNLNALLQRNLALFQAAPAGKEIEWAMQFERRLYTAKFDEAKMQQALVKVLDNAVEALGPRGRITLQTKNLDLTQPTQDRNAQLAAGSYVCMEVTDNGAGIEADILPRVFEPFFTTKRGEKHRGLGLAWVYGVVTNHGGRVALSSQPGVGTSVRIYLPADKKIVKDHRVPTDDLTGTQTILMVDDEDLLLTMGQTILSAYGYQVLTANSGQRALEILAQSEPGVDLLITDLIMPGMSGRELVQQVRRLSPDTQILCSSGYVHPNGQQTAEDADYLQKPFTSHDLLFKVKQALASCEGGGD